MKWSTNTSEPKMVLRNTYVLPPVALNMKYFQILTLDTQNSPGSCV